MPLDLTEHRFCGLNTSSFAAASVGIFLLSKRDFYAVANCNSRFQSRSNTMAGHQRSCMDGQERDGERDIEGKDYIVINGMPEDLPQDSKILNMKSLRQWTPIVIGVILWFVGVWITTSQ